MARFDPILIAGGGIAGLATALAFARRGLPSRVLERNSGFSDVGAGIQIGPNGIGVLRRLGIATRLAPSAVWPSAIEVRDGLGGRTLARLPLGNWLARRYGEPYAVVHRADLQAALLDAVSDEPLIDIVTGYRVDNITPTPTGVSVDSELGDRERGRALVGADGLWSSVRRWIDPEADLNFSGKTASRALIPIDAVPAPFAEVTTVWLMSGAHVVHYPVRGGRMLAVVVIVDGPWPGRGFGNVTEPAAVLSRIQGADRRLIGLLRQATEWRSWALYDPEPLEHWSKGPVVLAGDAAHPILPFLAQGGVMALEDAETLAACVARYGDDLPTAFAAYERQRRNRVERVQKASRRNGAIYHAEGLSRIARDVALRALPGMLVMAQYDWLYGWDGPAPLP